MKYYLIAGEASGDLHGSNLIKALHRQDAQATIRCWGGDLMQAAGATLVKHYKELSFMGFVEILRNLLTIFKNIAFCKRDVEVFQPDVVIFIDYSGFNLRIAKWAKKNGYRTNYYISPQVWASRASRVQAIKRDIDAMYVILPFEKEFYQQRHVKVTYVGHPLMDAIAERTQTDLATFQKTHRLENKPIIALLPGSRKQEISKMLSVMLSVIDDFSNYQFVIAGAPSQDISLYQPMLKDCSVSLVRGATYDLLSVAHAALVTSGTATLEAALFKVPQVVCYRGSAISYQIIKRIITLRFISLVNLIMDREVVKELIQNDLTAKNLKNELRKILNPTHRQKVLEDYHELAKILGGKGASERVAVAIVKKLES